MPVPKSVTKVKYKNGQSVIEYASFSDQAQYYTFELCRAGLRDVGKYIAKIWKQVYYENFTKHTGEGGKATKYYAISGKNTQFPRVQVGLRTGKVDGFYAYFQEFGTTKTERKGLLQKSVKDNISTIVEIESQYLTALDGEAEAINQLISEEDYDGEADE